MCTIVVQREATIMERALVLQLALEVESIVQPVLDHVHEWWCARVLCTIRRANWIVVLVQVGESILMVSNSWTCEFNDADYVLG